MASSMDLARNEEEIPDETEVKWINIIFVPFHFCLKLVVLCVVIVKCVMVSIQCFFAQV